MRKVILGLLMMVGLISIAQAQTDTGEYKCYPEVGKPCPDFTLNNVEYYSKKEASLRDFRGKWLVLDFWNKGCGACVASFPKTSELQKEFSDKVQFMLIGIEDKEGQIGPMYDKFREKGGYVMPCAFDSSLANKWDIYTAPYIIVLDPQGNVRTITYSLNSDDIHALLDGKPLRLPKVYRMHEEESDTLIAYDRNKFFLINGNGGEDSVFLFRSILSTFDGYKQHSSVPWDIIQDIDRGRIQILGAPLFMLYNFAYYGQPFPNKDSGYQAFPILELKDSAYFKYSEKYNKNLFCYCLNVPPSQATKERMQEMMLHDLGNYFPYSVDLEVRKFPCWRLVASDDAREQLLSKREGKPSFRSLIPKGEFIAENWPFKRFLHLLQGFNDWDIVDETGIDGNIDIHMDCLLTDIEDVKRALRNNGLDLIQAEKNMKVLVVRNNKR